MTMLLFDCAVVAVVIWGLRIWSAIAIGLAEEIRSFLRRKGGGAANGAGKGDAA